LNYSTHYYWQVVATDEHGAATTGPVWDFTTQSEANNPPNTPSTPSPVDGTSDQGIDVSLTWMGGDPDGDDTTYDVYFAAGDSSPDVLLCEATSSLSCSPANPLDYSTHYYWQVVATDEHGATTTGPVWDFTTQDPPTTQPLPLFESVLHLDGVDDYAASSDSIDLDIGDQDGENLTIEAWFKVTDTDPSTTRVENIVSKWQSYGLYIQLADGSDPDIIKFRLWRGDSDIFEITRFLYFMTPGWHHIAGVYNTTTNEVRLYYEGELQSSGAFTDPLYISENGISVGGLSDGNYFDGQIEEVRISDNTRYSGDTYTIPSSHFTCDSNTRALWHFDETAGSVKFYDGEDGPGSACGSVEDTLDGLDGATTGPG
jgi:hypothetical protein